MRNLLTSSGTVGFSRRALLRGVTEFKYRVLTGCRLSPLLMAPVQYTAIVGNALKCVRFCLLHGAGNINNSVPGMKSQDLSLYVNYEGWNFNFGNAAVTFDTAHLQSSYFHRPSMYSPKLCRTRSQR